MSFTVSGASIDDRGPAGCVARFLIAGAARDNTAAAAELHPDSLAQINGEVDAPPGIIAAEIGEPEDHGDCLWVPTRLLGEEAGSEQRFVFAVLQIDDRWGVHLEQSLSATFGGDPMQMMEDALRTAVAPLGAALDQVGDAFSSAFGGSDGSTPTARRIAAETELPAAESGAPSTVAAELYEIDLHRTVQRSDGEINASSQLAVRLRFDLEPTWSANACLGVTLDTARSLDGDELRPVDVEDDYGSERYASWERERRDFYCRLGLVLPPHGTFTGMAEVSGRVRLDLVGGELLEIALGPVGTLVGHEVPIPAMGCTLAFSRDEDGNVVLHSPAGWTDSLHELRPVDAEGNEMGDSWSSSGNGETDTRTYGMEIPDDAGFVIRFWAQRGVAELPFTATGLPLPLE